MSGALHRWYGLADLDRFAEREAELSGELEIKQLSRLRDMLSGDAGLVCVRMTFARGGEGWLGINLEYRTTLQLVCQRCLEPMDLEVDTEVGLGVIESDAIQLPAGREPITLAGDRLQPAQLIEDELIMALPLVPKHSTREECSSVVRRLMENDGAESAARDAH